MFSIYIRRLGTILVTFFIVGFFLASDPVHGAVDCQGVTKEGEIAKLEAALRDAMAAATDARLANAQGDVGAANNAGDRAADASKRARDAWLKLIDCDLGLTPEEEDTALAFADAAGHASVEANTLAARTALGQQTWVIWITIVIIIGGFVITIILIRRR